MQPLHRPIVYVGSTLSHAEVSAVFPDFIVRDPIARGDLHRDRILGGSVFLLLDGAFMQQRAVPPREVIDVARDGALVVGASSMGALRAAECWPVGVRGVGAIYRLFRRGLLDSDAEVVVASSLDGQGAGSVALINVRYAARLAERRGQLAPHQAQELVRIAEAIFYPHRTWQLILKTAGLRDPALSAALRQADLKKADAWRALRAIARWQSTERGFYDRPRRAGATLEPSELYREREPEPMSEGELERARPQILSWLWASGRYRRYAPDDAALAEPSAAAKLWDRLAASGEREAELSRWRAFCDALRHAQTEQLAHGSFDRHLAEQQIATEHDEVSFLDLLERLRDAPDRTAAIQAHRDELAAVKRVRRMWFGRELGRRAALERKPH